MQTFKLRKHDILHVEEMKHETPPFYYNTWAPRSPLETEYNALITHQTHHRSCQ
jgi:hypothetical protein